MNEVIAAHVSHRSLIQFYELALQAYARRIEELEKNNANMRQVIEQMRPKE